MGENDIMKKIRNVMLRIISGNCSSCWLMRWSVWDMCCFFWGWGGGGVFFG